jgi:hypothetical protein
MKKSAVTLFSILTILFLFVSQTGRTQAWVVYNGNELPTDANPPFTAADNSPDAGFVAEVVSDPDSAANKLFKYDHPVIEGKQTYKMDWGIGGGTTATIVSRIKGLESTEAMRIAEIDIRNVNTGIGSKFQVGYDDSIRLASPPLAAYFPNAKEWHIYRIVMNGADFSLYVDEKPEPVLSGTATTARTDNWFKFGDQSANFSHSGLFDYIIWDITGAYAPDQGAPIPDTLSKHYYGQQSGLQKQTSESVMLYPNPASGEFILISQNGWTDAKYRIFNSAGQVIRQGIIAGKTTVINVRGLSDGIYTLIVEKGKKVLYREKLIHKLSAN